jgi:ubiquinone/menaquinone biosynthesis C-methylase UbiE
VNTKDTRDTDEAFKDYQASRITHWDSLASDPVAFDRSGYYKRLLTKRYKQLVPENLRVLELGCGDGNLLNSLKPSRGLGIDFSEKMISIASEHHPLCEFRVGDAHVIDLDEKFDIVILSDLVNDVWDVQSVLENLQKVCTPSTRIVLNFYSKLWQLPLTMVRKIRFANPSLPQNWLTPRDIENLLRISGFETVSSSREVLMPLNLSMLSNFFNKYLVKIWPANHLALTNFCISRPERLHATNSPQTVSVIIPARNEAGNISEIIRRTPQMGSGTELIFVEGNSTDDTYTTIESLIESSEASNLSLLRQPGVGKGDAVRYGYSKSKGDILMILDADMTVAPEDLTRFYEAIASGRGEFINGVRLIYPMEGEAMRFLNFLGNKLFGLAFSWLLYQPVKDTLCGTKVLTRKSYDRIAANRDFFGDFDPFGDFDLLFGAAKLNLKIVDVPIRYRDRTYGSTNINRWRHGMLLLKMSSFAAKKLRFV